MADKNTSIIAGIVDFWREAGPDKWFVKDENI